ncbi:hypothetical protein Plhal304r1_c059g0147711 [Plasmopara halstedii]
MILVETVEPFVCTIQHWIRWLSCHRGARNPYYNAEIAACRGDVVRYPPAASSLHLSSSTLTVGPQAMEESSTFVSAPSRASGRKRRPNHELCRGNQQRFANMAPTSYSIRIDEPLKWSCSPPWCRRADTISSICKWATSFRSTTGN